MRTGIKAAVSSFIVRDLLNAPEMQLSEDEELIRKGLIDSIGIVRLMAFIQDRFGIEEIERNDMVLDNFRTLQAITQMVEKYVPLVSVAGREGSCLDEGTSGRETTE